MVGTFRGGNCCNCIFWTGRETFGTAECRYSPPIPLNVSPPEYVELDNDNRAWECFVFPVTSCDHWCGKYESRFLPRKEKEN